MSARAPAGARPSFAATFISAAVPAWPRPEATSAPRQAGRGARSGVRGSELRKSGLGVAELEGGVSSGAETSGLRLWVLSPGCPGSWASGGQGVRGRPRGGRGGPSAAGQSPVSTLLLDLCPQGARAHSRRVGRGCILGSNWGQTSAKILGQAWGAAGVALAEGWGAKCQKQAGLLWSSFGKPRCPPRE